MSDSNNYTEELKRILEILKVNDLETLAHKYYEAYKDAKKKLPYWINLVAAMNSGKNENGHTRFLYKLFCYTANETHPIFNSFINRFTKKNWKCKVHENENKILINHTFLPQHDIKTIRHPDIYVNQMPSDGADNPSISVIIENKIDDAKDREEQVEDYIKGMYYDRNEEGKDFCYAFYLIDKEESRRTDKTDESHDSKGRQRINKKGLISDDHYILLRYKEDILPWLKNEVLVSLNEEYLILNIKLYIQYLENRFGLREDINSVKLKTLKNMEGMENLNLKELLSIQEGIHERLKEYINIFANHLEKRGYEEDTKSRKKDLYAEYLKKIGTHTICAIFNLQDYTVDMNCGLDDYNTPITIMNNYNNKDLESALSDLDKELDKLEKETQNS